MKKQDLVITIETAHQVRVDRAIEARRMNPDMQRELNSARDALLHDAALSYMIRHKFTEGHVQAIYREAQKTIKKIATTMQAIVEKRSELFDYHTFTVLAAAFYLADDDVHYSYDEIKNMQSREVVTRLTARLEKFARRTYAQSTLSAQTPTSIHALELLNLASVKEEGKKARMVKFALDRKELQFMTAG